MEQAPIPAYHPPPYPLQIPHISLLCIVGGMQGDVGIWNSHRNFQRHFQHNKEIREICEI